MNWIILTDHGLHSIPRYWLPKKTACARSRSGTTCTQNPPRNCCDSPRKKTIRSLKKTVINIHSSQTQWEANPPSVWGMSPPCIDSASCQAPQELGYPIWNPLWTKEGKDWWLHPHNKFQREADIMAEIWILGMVRVLRKTKRFKYL